jgi:hypothetical protein
MPERRGGSQVLVAGGSWFMNHIGLASWNPVAPADHHQRDTSVLSMCPLPPAAEAMVLLGSGGARLVVVLGETDQLPLIFGVGAESISIHSRDAVSSSTSIALSDRNRSVMSRSARLQAADDGGRAASTRMSPLPAKAVKLGIW